MPARSTPPEELRAEVQNPTLELERERRTVSFDTYDLAVRQILDMIGSNDINVAPEYQRKFVWEETRQSEFIESVFLGIPNFEVWRSPDLSQNGKNARSSSTNRSHQSHAP